MQDNWPWVVSAGNRVIVFPAGQPERAAAEAQALRDAGEQVFESRMSATEIETIAAGAVPLSVPLYRRLLAAVTGRPSVGADVEPLTVEYRH